ncbi:flavin reductase family protein [Brucellaceae bacterium C25G]
MTASLAYRPQSTNDLIDHDAVTLASIDELKYAMRQLASGVSVVTTGTGEARTGATVTSATAFSMDPPTVIVNINLSSSVWYSLKQHNHFCLNILSSGQQNVADNFAGKGGVKGAARYGHGEWYELESGALALSGALASVDCRIDEIIERHTHAIIIGRALKIASSGGAPLLYHDANYKTLF